MLRWMLVWEDRDTDTLWLLKTAPRRLYQPKLGTYSIDLPARMHSTGVPLQQNIVSVAAAPTRFGEVSYTLQMVGDLVRESTSPLRLVCNVTLALHGRGFVDDDGMTLMLRLRDPEGTRLVSQASVESIHGGSATVGKVDGDSETIEVKVRPREHAKGLRTETSFSVVAVFE